MRQNLLSKSNFDILHFLKSRIPSNKSAIFIFTGLIIFFITFQISFFQSRSKSPVVVINDDNNVSAISKPKLTHRYSFLLHERLVPNFVENIIDKAQPPATCLIIIRTSDGAIGNRMFFFASAYGLARLHQCSLYVAPWIIKDLRAAFVVNITNTPVHLVTNDTVVNQTGLFHRYSACTLYDDLLKVPLHPNLTIYEMTGFYQAFGYFVKYKDEITYLFQFHQVPIERNVPLVEQLVKAVWNIPLDLGNYTKDNVTHQYLKSILTRPPAPLVPVTWVGVHIRRGDILTFFKINTSVDFLHTAMNYYRRKYMNCRFLIASDDKPFVKAQLGNNTDVFITPTSFFWGDDLAALALCEHSIVTAGTYGWWSAWLAGGDVVHDINYPVASQNCIREHYFPPWFVFPHNSSSQKSR